MTKIFLFAFVIIFLFTNSDCKKGIVDPPPVLNGDTLAVVERTLTDGEQPAVSPDGSKIAFSYKGDIFVMDTSVQTTTWWDGKNWRYDTTGGKITQLTSGTEIDILPRWNPNGQTIGFIRKNTGEANKGLIYNVPASGGTATQFILNQYTADDGDFQWSPEGKYIALLSYNNITSKFYLSIVTTTNSQVVYTTQFYSSFVWSLNPDEIVLTIKSTNPNRSGDVWLVNFITNKAVKDSLYFQDPVSLCRSPLSNKFAYNSTPLASVKIIATDFSNQPQVYNVSSGGGLRWSFDEKYFLYDWMGYLYGPYGYSYSRLAIFSIERNKEYLLTKSGDVNRFNTFFEWGHSPNTVYFERNKKINVVYFSLPK